MPFSQSLHHASQDHASKVQPLSETIIARAKKNFQGHGKQKQKVTTKTPVYLNIAPKLRDQALVEVFRVHSSVFLLDETTLRRVPIAKNVDDCCSVTAKACKTIKNSEILLPRQQY